MEWFLTVEALFLLLDPCNDGHSVAVKVCVQVGTSLTIACNLQDSAAAWLGPNLGNPAFISSSVPMTTWLNDMVDLKFINQTPTCILSSATIDNVQPSADGLELFCRTHIPGRSGANISIIVIGDGIASIKQIEVDLNADEKHVDLEFFDYQDCQFNKYLISEGSCSQQADSTPIATLESHTMQERINVKSRLCVSACTEEEVCICQEIDLDGFTVTYSPELPEETSYSVLLSFSHHVLIETVELSTQGNRANCNVRNQTSKVSNQMSNQTSKVMLSCSDLSSSTNYTITVEGKASLNNSESGYQYTEFALSLNFSTAARMNNETREETGLSSGAIAGIILGGIIIVLIILLVLAVVIVFLLFKWKRKADTKTVPAKNPGTSGSSSKSCGNDKVKNSVTSPAEFNTDIASDTNNIKVNLPVIFCAGREEMVTVTAIAEKVRQRIRVELTKTGREMSEVVAINPNYNDKDGSCLLFVKPKEEGEHLLSITVSGLHIPSSPFLLPVNNRDYYISTLKQPVQTIDIPSPRHIAFSSNGDMFVTSTATHSIHVYDKHGQFKKEIGKPGKGNLEFSSPRGIAINGEEVFVSDMNNHRVQRFSTNGEFLSEIGSHGSGVGKLNLPQGLTIDPEGQIYVSDGGNNQIVVFSKFAVFVRKIIIKGIVRDPQGLAISLDGNLHVVGYKSNTYAVFSPANKLVRSHQFRKATDVAIDTAGFGFAIGFTTESNSLTIFNTQGEVIHIIKIDRPWGVAIAPDGSVWVAGFYSEKLWKF